MNPPSRFNPNTNAFSDYWEFEDGKQMLTTLGRIPPLSIALEKVPLLFQKDDLADRVIAEHFNQKSFPEALQSLTDYVMGKLPMNSATDSVQLLLAEMSYKPEWLNPKLINLGREVCNRSGKSGLIVLRNYSLMLGYQSAAINKPLIATGALHSGAVKRIADTTNFWYAVTGEDALTPGADGYTYCLRTRIVHAYSRIMIKQKLDWNIADQGEPLNLWDMVATYLGFSLVFMQGLKKLGLTITNTEAQAVYHLWKYIGYLIGIPPHLMPDNDNDAIENLYLWSKTQPEPDTDSIALAQALHLEPLSAPWPKMLWQKKMIQQVNLAFNYYLIGKRSCAELELPEPKYPMMANVVKAVNKIDDKLGSLDWYRKSQINRGRAEQLVIRE